MSETAVEVTDTDLSNWAPGCRLFSGSDGKHFIIDADVADYPDGPIKIVRRQTAVLYCGPGGEVTDLIPDHLYPPGTTPEEVLSELGYSA